MTVQTVTSAQKQPAYTCNGKPIGAPNFYQIACDPKRSVAIEACAGAGKTWMLVSRILRALLEGTEPEAILAITYTKKAAGEMRSRLYEWLRDFAHEEDDSKLVKELVARGVPEQKAPSLLPQLRGLHLQLLSQSRSVEIRTFHSWFAQLLSAAPLGILHQLGLPVRYDLLEDDSELFDGTWYALLQRCTQDAELRQDLEALLVEQGEHNTREALQAAWARRIEFMLADQNHVLDRSIANTASPSDELLSEGFKLRWLGYAKALGLEKTKTPQSAALDIEYTFTRIAHPIERLMALRNAIFVKAEDRLNNNLQKFEAAQQAEIELVALLQQHYQHQGYIYQQRMARLTRALLDGYAHLKRTQNIVDMADLERAALLLLGDTQTYGWVAQRLDARISQVLIDEFQDTNPLQWQALRGWLSAYAGAGGGGSLSVFIVGDPKQSIYRFRRADPAVFIAACGFVQHTLGGSMLACDHTRRNAPEVIHAVNAVFSQAQALQQYQGFREHTTEVLTNGAVARLPIIERAGRKKQADEVPLWRDSLTEPRYLEEEKLRLKEITQVVGLMREWIAEKGWKPSDIKVLSRRKDRLRDLLLALNHKQIPWRFADDVHLIDTLEVQDLVSLLDVLSSPINDLSLAQVLRSPIFSLDDEELILLAENVASIKGAVIAKEQGENIKLQPHQVLTSWWDALQLGLENKQAEKESHLNYSDALLKAALQLQKWQKWAQTLPPHDLLDAIYSDAQILEKYGKAVPAAMRESVIANLQAFLQQALSLEGGRFATPYHFVRTLRQKGIKSEHPEESETVELLTIHGAKGLEAKGIIILDTDPRAPRTDRLSVLMDWPAVQPAPIKFIFYVDQKSLPVDIKGLATQEEAANAIEELNALYVAMTRASEKLVFSALQARTTGVNEGSWWQRLDAVASHAQVLDLPAQGLQSSPEEIYDTQLINRPAGDIHHLLNTGPDVAPAALKPFMYLHLPPVKTDEEGRAVTVAAVSADVYQALQAETGEQGVARASIASKGKQMQAQRFGNAVHRFLELENTEDVHIQAVINTMGLTYKQALEAAAQAKKMMQHPDSQMFFDPLQIERLEKEVELYHGGQVLRIDRLVKCKGEWWALDFKSASAPLNGQWGEDYEKQLRRYKEALQETMPSAVVRIAIITGNGSLQEIAEHR